MRPFLSLMGDGSRGNKSLTHTSKGKEEDGSILCPTEKEIIGGRHHIPVKTST